MTVARSTPGGPRMAALIGPEVVATILIIVVAIVGVIAVSTPPGPAAAPSAPPSATAAAVASATPAPSAVPTATPAPTPSPAPSATPTPGASTVPPVTVGPSASPGSTGQVGGIVGSPKPSPTPSPTPTPRPVQTLAPWATAARAVIAADARVVEWRESVRAILAQKLDRADEVAKRLRSLNAAMAVALTAIDALDAGGSPTYLTGLLRATHQSATDISVATLKGSVIDVKPYLSGATAVLGALDPLESELHDLASVAGLPDPYPGAAVSPTP